MEIMTTTTKKEQRVESEMNVCEQNWFGKVACLAFDLHTQGRWESEKGDEKV